MRCRAWPALRLVPASRRDPGPGSRVIADPNSVELDGLRCCDRSSIKVAWTAQNWTRRNAPVDLARPRNGWPGGQVANEDQAGAGVSRH
jgi:hypothetical protein